MSSAARTVIHLSPHPDDEALGAPATLLALKAGGHRVVNLVCSLGRPGDHARRRAEAHAAARHAGFALRIAEPPFPLSSGDDRAAAEPRLAAWIGDAVRSLGADLVVGPSPHDRHPAHEAVGRAARDAIAALGGPRMWLWGLWADLPLPTLLLAFGDAELGAAVRVLEAHAGELRRNDYADGLRGRAVAARVLGAERVFGFGGPGLPGRYAELLTEVAFADGEWWAGAPRLLDPGALLTEIPRDRPLGWWMRAESFTDRLAPGAAGTAGPAGRSPVL